MSKALSEVVSFEFIRQIKKPSFWATILLIPLMIVGVFLISMLTSNDNQPEVELDENTKVAVTDEAGILPKEMPILTKYTTEEGKQKVIEGDIDLFFYIPADFEEAKKIELYHISEGLEIFNMDGQVINGILSQAVAPKFDKLDVIALTGQFEVQDNKYRSCYQLHHCFLHMLR